MKYILLAEDENVSRFFLRKFVHKVIPNVTIIEARDGVEAFQKFKKNKIDLVITDIRMPNSDGCDLISNIRKLNKNVPIIIESAHSDDIDDCENVEEIISKPIRPDELKKIIDKYLI
jgi:YesN/AraC family two-component response regulator